MRNLQQPISPDNWIDCLRVFLLPKQTIDLFNTRNAVCPHQNARRAFYAESRTVKRPTPASACSSLVVHLCSRGQGVQLANATGSSSPLSSACDRAAAKLMTSSENKNASHRSPNKVSALFVCPFLGCVYSWHSGKPRPPILIQQ